MSTTTQGLTLPMPALRAPAWERLPNNQKATNQPSAIDGYVSLGEYDVELAPVYVPDGSGALTLDAGHLAIRRSDTNTVFDIVSKNYALISPSQFATLLDTHLNREVECFAHMRGGRRQIAVYSMPEFEVAGDPMTSHLMLINDMSGYRAMRAIVGVYRGLCLNGQVFFDANGMGKVFHDHRLEENFIQWLTYLPTASVAKTQAMAEVYTHLAQTPTTSAEAIGVIERVYPLPVEPSTFGPKAIVEDRQRAYETERARVITIRGEAFELYRGAGTGMDHPACAGTAWGLLQAFTELEEYRPGRMVAESNILGSRQQIKGRAYQAVCDLAGIHN